MAALCSWEGISEATGQLSSPLQACHTFWPKERKASRASAAPSANSQTGSAFANKVLGPTSHCPVPRQVPPASCRYGLFQCPDQNTEKNITVLPSRAVRKEARESKEWHGPPPGQRGRGEARTLDVSTLAAKQFIFLTSIPQFLCLTPLPFLTPVPRVHRPLDKMLPGMWPLGVSVSCGTH